MVSFTVNDVLLKHNNDVLSYAVDSVGNRKFQVYLDIYRSAFSYAEQRKDTVTCNKIVTDIVDTVCFKSVPNGRFLEFDEQKNVWYNVGTGAIPCQRARTGLLGLLGKTTSNDYHVDKPVIDMSKTKRARTMKALHFSEKKLRAVVNLNDERFKLKEQVLLDDAVSCVPLVEKKVTNKRPIEKRVTFAESVTSNCKSKDKDRSTTKRRKVASNEDEHVDVICGGSGEGILHLDTPGNRLYHSLINAREKHYSISNDKEKFQEVCKVIKLMQRICPSCRFVTQKVNSDEVTELDWQEIMEKTIQSFCNPCTTEDLSDKEIDKFMSSLKNEETYNNYISDASNDVPEIIMSSELHGESLKSDVHFPEEVASDITIQENRFNDSTITTELPKSTVPKFEDVTDETFPTIIIHDDKVQSDKTGMVVDCLCDNASQVLTSQEQQDYLDVFFPEVDGNMQELTAADEFLRSILVS